MSKGPKKILVVEDEPDIVDVLVFLLEREGYEVACASNGLLALERLAKKVPDLVLTDVMMPSMDGCELLRTIRQSKEMEALPVLVLSALPEEAVRKQCKTASAILGKPFQTAHLLAAVRALVTTPGNPNTA